MLKFEVPDLYVKDYSNDFKKRQESLFDALEAAEKEHSEIIAKVKTKKPKSTHQYNQRSFTKGFRGKESIFKTPETPLSRLKAKKYFGRPPGKWIKYSLNDVPDEHMSEGSNARAAFSFLREMEERKRAVDRIECMDDFKPVFKKPEIKMEEENDVKCKEYNFGQVSKKIHQKKNKSVINDANDSTSCVKLNHLQFDEDE